MIEKGKVYKVKSICNSDCIFEFKILSRTTKRITVETFDGIKTVGVKLLDGKEVAYPLGKYSMCPVIRG